MSDLFNKISKLEFSIFYSIILCLGLCKHSFGQEVSKIRIDPRMAYGGKVSDYFDQIEYIPLETTRQSLFGDITQMIVTDSSIVISDIDTRSVLFFSISGKYLTKVKLKSSQVPNLSIDKENREIIVLALDMELGTIEPTYYTILGTKENGTIPNKMAFKNTNLTSIGGGYFAGLNSCNFLSSEVAKDSIYYLINIYKGKSLVKSLLPYNQKKQLAFCYLGGTLGGIENNVISESCFYISTPYEHFLYKINKDTAIKINQFVFESNRTIPSYVLASHDLKYLDSVKRNNQNNTEMITDVRNIFFQKNHLFFKLNPGRYIFHYGSEEDNQYNFIYDTLSKRLVSIERLSPDENNYFLPFIGNGNMMATNGLYFSSGYFYSSVSSLQMFNAKENTKTRMPRYPILLQNYFETQNRKSNPVIARMKLKELK